MVKIGTETKTAKIPVYFPISREFVCGDWFRRTAHTTSQALDITVILYSQNIAGMSDGCARKVQKERIRDLK